MSNNPREYRRQNFGRSSGVFTFTSTFPLKYAIYSSKTMDYAPSVVIGSYLIPDEPNFFDETSL
jgi:hypothetical protein